MSISDFVPSIIAFREGGMTRMSLIISDIEDIFSVDKMFYTKFGIAVGGTSHSWYSFLTPPRNIG